MEKGKSWFIFKKLIIKIFVTYINLLSMIRLNGSIQNLFNFSSAENYKIVVEDFEEYLNKKNIYDPVEIFDYFMLYGMAIFPIITNLDLTKIVIYS